ncbi:MAG: hypothetical protein JNK37_24930 [Verrucomicrobiales bacterium]|nr:hypothetical protein [Verrucomicrobiales bacterium]
MTDDIEIPYSEEAFSVKEREIAALFEATLANANGNAAAESEARIARILERAKASENVSNGDRRIEKILERIHQNGGSGATE